MGGFKIQDPLWRAVIALCGSYDKAKLLVEVVSEGPLSIRWATATEVAERTRLPKPTVIRCLSLLSAFGILQKNNRGWKTQFVGKVEFAPDSGEVPKTEKEIDQETWDRLAEVVGGKEQARALWDSIVRLRLPAFRLSILLAESGMDRWTVKDALGVLTIAKVLRPNSQGWGLLGKWVPPKEAECST